MSSWGLQVVWGIFVMLCLTMRVKSVWMDLLATVEAPSRFSTAVTSSFGQLSYNLR